MDSKHVGAGAHLHRVAHSITLLALVSVYGAAAAGLLDGGRPREQVQLDACVHHVEAQVVEMQLTPGGNVSAHEFWLLDNRPDWLHSTGQKTGLLDLTSGPSLQMVSCDSNALTVTWGDVTGMSSVEYPVDFLARWLAPSDMNRHGPVLTPAAWATSAGHDYESIGASEEALLSLLEDLEKNGVALIHNAPLHPEVGENITHLMSYAGPMETLYGRSFQVRTSPKSGPQMNIAYSSASLGLHQDLAYYESMPGFQLLHCRAFEGVIGGESLLMDVFHIAEVLRQEDHSAFKTLTEIPMTFIKFDMERERKAHWEYRTPHIIVHPDTGDIIKVVWSPPFEGPLLAPIERVAEYYRAKKAFVETLERLQSTHQLEFTLKPGQVLIFNNIRMLHGRRAFSEEAAGKGLRLLEGWYVNIDEFRNKLQTTRRLVTGALPGVHESLHIGNRCF